MKVKKYCPEYTGWKTENQWANENKIIIDQSKAVELWTNQFCVISCIYASADNVRSMTKEEVKNLKIEKSKARKKAEERRKEHKAAYERRCNYAAELRENWHTVWQWLSEYRREVNDGATFRVGKQLNEWIGRDWCVFGSDYCYFNIKDTRLITDEDEYQKLLEESNKKYREYDLVSYKENYVLPDGSISSDFVGR